MTVPLIRTDQARPSGTSVGTGGIARNDLWETRTCTSTSVNTAGSYKWKFLDRPPGSLAVLSSTVAISTQWTPDEPGTYRLFLGLDGADFIDNEWNNVGTFQILVYRVRYDVNGAIVNRGWALPAFGEEGQEANYDGNTRGYDEPFRFIIDDLLNFLATGGANPIVGGDLSGFASSATVHAIQGHEVSTDVPADGDIMTYVGVDAKWEPKPITSFLTLAGDVVGSLGANIVMKLRGAAIGTAAGALVAGSVLRVTGGSSADWGPLDLANTDATQGYLPASRIDPTMNLHVNDGQFDGDLLVAGDLTVNGTTTTVNSTVVDIADRVIHMNHADIANVAVPTLIAGIAVERGDTLGAYRDSAGIFWRESSSYWQFAKNTTADDSTVGADLAIRALGATFSGLGGSGAGLVGVSNTGLISFESFAALAGATAVNGDVTGTIDATVVEKLTGAAGLVDLYSAALRLNAASGAFPAIGNIRSKNIETIIAAEYSGSDFGLVSWNSNTLIFGGTATDSNVVNGIQFDSLSSWGFYKPGVSTYFYWLSGAYKNQMYYTGGSPTIEHRQQDSNTATFDFQWAAQDAYASATGTNRNGGNAWIRPGLKASGGVDGGVKIGQSGFATRGTAAGAAILLPYDSEIRFRDVSGTGNIAGIYMVGNVLYFGSYSSDAAVPTSIYNFATGSIHWNAAGADLYWNGDDLIFQASLSHKIFQAGALSDVATKDFTVSAQAPYSSATGANRKAGDWVVDIPASISTPNHSGGFAVSYAGDKIITMGEYQDNGNAYGAIWFGAQARAMSSTNWSFFGGGGSTYFNSVSGMYFAQSATYVVSIQPTQMFFAGAASYSTPSYYLDFSATAIFHFGVDATSAKIMYDAQTSDTSTKKLTFKGQDAYASSTGTNRRGGSIDVLIGTNKSGYTSDYGGINIGYTSETFAAAGTIRVSNNFLMQGYDGTSGDNTLVANFGGVMSWGGWNGDTAFYCYTSGELLMYGTAQVVIMGDDTIQIGGNSGIGGISDSAGGTSNRPWQWLVTSYDITAGDHTASAFEASCVIITITGTPGATYGFVLPDIVGSFYIVKNNNGSGASVRFGKTAATGVTVTVGKSQIIRHDGSEYVAVTAAF